MLHKRAKQIAFCLAVLMVVSIFPIMQRLSPAFQLPALGASGPTLSGDVELLEAKEGYEPLYITHLSISGGGNSLAEKFIPTFNNWMIVFNKDVSPPGIFGPMMILRYRYQIGDNGEFLYADREKSLYGDSFVKEDGGKWGKVNGIRVITIPGNEIILYNETWCREVPASGRGTNAFPDLYLAITDPAINKGLGVTVFTELSVKEPTGVTRTFVLDPVTYSDDGNVVSKTVTDRAKTDENRQTEPDRPTVTLDGNVETITQGDAYTDAGASVSTGDTLIERIAFVSEDGVVSEATSVDTSKLGEYYLFFSASNEAGFITEEVFRILTILPEEESSSEDSSEEESSSEDSSEEESSSEDSSEEESSKEESSKESSKETSRESSRDTSKNTQNSRVDTSPNAAPAAPVVDQKAIVSKVKTAIAGLKKQANPSKTLTAKLGKAESITAQTLKEVQALAKQAGVDLTVEVEGDAGTLSLPLFTLQGNLETISLKMTNTSSMSKKILTLFEKYYSNKTMILDLGQRGDFGMKVSFTVPNTQKFTAKNLNVYTYNIENNTYTKLANSNIIFDTDGKITITVTAGQFIVLSDGPMAK